MPIDDETSQFYQTPNPVEEEPSSEGIQLPLTRARRVTLNHAIAFSSIMVMVLVFAVWLVLQEKPIKQIVDAQEEKLNLEDPSEAGAVTNTPQASQLSIKLYDGPYLLDFMPETGKPEGLSLFYVINDKEIPFSEYFRVKSEVLQQNQAQVSTEASLASAPRRSTVEIPAAPEADSEATLSRSDVYLKIARRHLDSENYDKAAVTLERLLGVDKDHLQAGKMLLEAYVQLMKHEKALVLFERLDQKDALSGADLSDYGVILARQGELDRAQVVLERAYVLSPEDPDPGINYALNCLLLSQWDRAVEVLEAVLARFPDHPDALGQLAYAHLGSGQYATARAVAKRYLNQVGDSSSAQLIIAETYAMERNVAQAVLWLKLVRQQLGPTEFAGRVKRPTFQYIQEHPEFQALLN